jgi:hypothetical protein
VRPVDDSSGPTGSVSNAYSGTQAVTAGGRTKRSGTGWFVLWATAGLAGLALVKFWPMVRPQHRAYFGADLSLGIEGHFYALLKRGGSVPPTSAASFTHTTRSATRPEPATVPNPQSVGQ